MQNALCIFRIVLFPAVAQGTSDPVPASDSS